MTAPVQWIEDLDAKLKKLWAEGMFTREIGLALGKSKNAIVGRAHRLGLSSRPNPAKVAGTPVKPQTPREPRPARLPKSSASAAMSPRAALVSRPSPAVTFARPSVTRACQWPLNDGYPWTFCSAFAQAGHVYCAEHHARAVIKRSTTA
jgi:GcrA cell cycle regulator